MEYGDINVIYASETGTAEDVAYKLFHQLQSQYSPLNAKVSIFSIQDVDPTVLPSLNTVVVIASTTGDGDVPTSMRAFWTFLLRRSLASDSLKGLKIAVFGLGDSGYEKYNAAAR